MRKILLLISALPGVMAYAQTTTIANVGINTQTPKATLHIEAGQSAHKGIIIPRITAQEMKTMSALDTFGNDQDALLVYLNETMPIEDRIDKLVNVIGKGYYHYNGVDNKWYPIQDLRVVGNHNHITYDAGVKGNGSDAAGTDNIGIGKNALFSKVNFSSFNPSNNIAIGVSSLYSNIYGHDNIALGKNSLYSNTSGHRNVVLGFRAMENADSAEDNVAIGAMSMYEAKGGNRNIAIGRYSLNSSKQSYNNIAIGGKFFKIIC